MHQTKHYERESAVARFAGRRDDGKYPFVVTTRWFDQETRKLVWAIDLLHARMENSFSNQAHTTNKVRRATAAEAAELDRG